MDTHDAHLRLRSMTGPKVRFTMLRGPGRLAKFPAVMLVHSHKVRRTPDTKGHITAVNVNVHDDGKGDKPPRTCAITM